MYTKNLNYTELLDNFLHFKRSCGYKYRSEETILKAFHIYTQEYKRSSLGLTKEFLEEWSRLSVREGRKSLSNRVAVIREFALYLNNLGHKVHVLRPLKNATNKSFIPYIFSKEEIAKIFSTLDNLKNSKHNQYNSHEVYPVLFRMLYGCGLRISEALGLKIKNVDTESGKLLIDVAKYDKPRIVMMSESLKVICREYKNCYLIACDEESTFFQHKNGQKRSRSQVNNFFRQILYKVNIPYLGRGKGPYLHNLRHTYACHAFYKMHTQGVDMNVGISIISIYLGHESIKATERYLKLSQEIFPELRARMKQFNSDIFIEIDYEQ